MIIEIPDEVVARAPLGERAIKLAVLAFLYQKRVLTLERASKMAGVTRLDFQHVLADQNIPIHYDLEDLEMDLRHIADLKR
jgi:predicted HTH domain antitoxin